MSTHLRRLYKEINISKINKDTLAFLPLLVDVGHGKKAVILEADLENYPGMFVNVNEQTRQGLVGAFAPYPLEEKQGGFNMLNLMVTKRADYIAKTRGTRSYPWRAIVISQSDKELLIMILCKSSRRPHALLTFPGLNLEKLPGIGGITGISLTSTSEQG